MYCWKMPRHPTLAGFCLLFVSATPVGAQDIDDRGERLLRPDIRLQDSAPAAPALPQTSPEANLFQDARPGVGVTRQSYREQDGTAALISGLVRSWPLSAGTSAGLGLFSVMHDDQKEPEFRRSWSAKNLGPRDRRIAAVGLNVRF